jgi:flagellar export protein FliJ
MSSKAMKKLLALRSIEEGTAETELAKQRRLRQICLDELEAHLARKHVASCALHHALTKGDRTEAISAEMALACGPLERRILQRQLAHLERSVESATAAWQHSRIRRLQVETVLEAEGARRKRDSQLREQKALDAWFLCSRSIRCSVQANESFQRELRPLTEDDGTARATCNEE